MRSSWVLFIVVIAVGSLLAVPTLADDLVGHWPFDGDYNDASGTGNHGTAIGGVLGFDTGVEGQAVVLDGVNGYVALAQNAITTTEFTVAAWARMSGSGGGIDSQNVVFQQRDNTGNPNHSTIHLFAGLTSGNSFFSARSSSGSADICQTPQPNNGEWHHFAGVVDAATLSLYVDGTLVDSVPNTQSGDYITSIDYVDIGRHAFNSQDYGFFNGRIDDVRVYDYALSGAEIRGLAGIFSDGFENGDTTAWEPRHKAGWEE